MIVCRDCGLAKPPSAFSNNRQRKNGKSCYCKECTAKRDLVRRSMPGYKERRKEYHKRYYAENRERIVAKVKAYESQLTKEELDTKKARQAAWTKANRDRCNRRNRQWAKNNPDKMQAMRKAHYNKVTGLYRLVSGKDRVPRGTGTRAKNIGSALRRMIEKELNDGN